MSRYSVFLWLCILVSFVLPWLLATIFAWVYTEIYEKESSSGREPESPALGYVTAVLHTSSFVVYVVFVCAALLCIGIVGRPDSHWAYCCLVLGIPVFCVVPVTAGSLALISAFGRGALIGRNIGITAAVLCFISSLPCCCVLVCALTCGTRAKGKRSRYPVPLAYIPVLGEWPQRQDKWEKKRQQRKFTDDYPSDCPPGPVPDYKAVRAGSVDSGGVKSSSNSNGKLPSVDGVSVVKGNSDYTASRDHRKKCATKSSDNSRKTFSFTSFLKNPSTSSSSSANKDGSSENPIRRHSEPAMGAMATAEKGHPVKTQAISRPNPRKGSITNTTFKEVCGGVRPQGDL